MNLLDNDYNNWTKENLNMIVSRMRKDKVDIKDKFNDESKKYKMFWELCNVENGIYYFENINYKLNGRL